MLRIFEKTIQKAANLFGYRISKITSYAGSPTGDEFEGFYKKCKPYTMTSKGRMYALYKAVRYIVENKIPGDFVECGVWKGGSTMLIAYTLLALKDKERKIYLYDTYEGLPEPSEEDYTITTRMKAIFLWKKRQKKDYNEWCFSPLEEVTHNMRAAGYPEEKLEFVKGKVEETIPGNMPKKISILRLDTDWYESTKHELEHLFPVLEKNGVLIIDDYGYWAGSTKATDEFLKKYKIPILLIDNHGGGSIGVKITEGMQDGPLRNSPNSV